MTNEMFERGLSNRSAVLGEAHVARSLREATDFGRPLQELVTEYCWGAVWGRPGLTFQMRSLINIAMLTALNRQSELATHVRGAITNGCTEEEIREVLMQTAIYCGVPAALEATRTAEDTLRTIATAQAASTGSEDNDG
ncbi:MAG TPA: carboxymuconolactone decarboxylase family protein [Galbitalea sp.]|jgi:4-carboxymuconolactone decarboxylase|nr:carboxymuconolactone decarboxylase family protein [Galbitalea sp.]